ncbi:MAG: hypothetical protein V1918_07795 [Planctomycetota bacterium]
MLETDSARPAPGVVRDPRARRLLLLSLVVTAVYGQTLLFPRLAWDDRLYIGRNPEEVLPLSRAAVAQAFQPDFGGTRKLYGYRPVQLVSYSLDRTLWGGRDFGYHLGNVLYHLACAWLVCRLVRRLGASESAAFYSALLFAVFPYHVEAVAWITERKSLLACLGMLAALDADLSFRQTGRRRRYAFALFWYAFSLLSKSAWVTGPALFLGAALLPQRDGRRPAVALKSWLVRFLPGYLFLALAASAVQIEIGNAANVVPLGHRLGGRLAFVLATYGHYLLSFVRILRTNPVDEWAWAWYEAGYPPLWVLALSAAALGGLGILCGRAWQRGVRWPAVAFGWFLVSLLPVSNLVPMLYPHGDRFLYGPSLAALVPAGILLSWMAARPRWDKLPWAILLALAAVSFLTAQRWESDARLWDYAIEQDRQSQVANYNYASVLRENYGQYEESIPFYNRALGGRPGWYFHANKAESATENLLAIYAGYNRRAEAVALCEWALKESRLSLRTRWLCRDRLIREARLENDAAEMERLLADADAPSRETALYSFHRAYWLVLVGHYAEAEPFLQDPRLDALESAGDRVMRRFLQATCSEARGDLAGALGFLKEIPPLPEDKVLQETVARRIARLEAALAPPGAAVPEGGERTQAP